MKFSNLLFPDRRDPERDGIVIDEPLRDAWLSDALGVDVIWLVRTRAFRLVEESCSDHRRPKE